jgi:hypothetical protein
MRRIAVSNDQKASIQAAAERVMELEEEVEASGQATVDGAALDRARAALHRWIDEVQGVVVSPGLGRVTLIHEGGRVSTIASPDLPFAMSAPDA